MSKLLTSTLWDVSFDAVCDTVADPKFAPLCHPDGYIGDQLTGYMNSLREGFEDMPELSQIEVIDAADTSAKLMLDAYVRSERRINWSDCTVIFPASKVQGWAIVRYTATSQTGETVTSDLLLVIDAADGFILAKRVA